jgi:cation diffusion facilitator family transporter
VSHGHDHHEHGHDAGHVHEHSHGLRGFLSSIFKPHSHDAADGVDDALQGSKDGIRAVKFSLLGLAITAILQLVIVVLSGSAALLADTIHNLGDASTAIPLWIAFSLSGRTASRRYTYGYGRAEDLAGVFVILMIVASAIFAGYESIDRLFNPREIDNLGWVAAAGVLGFAGNEVVAQYRIRVGKRIGSAALIADGYHARTDGFTSIAVVLGVLGVWLGFRQADPLIGLAITVAIVFVLKGAFVQVWHRLMDGIEPGAVSSAEAAALSVQGVVGVSLVRARWVGHQIHAEARVTVDQDISVSEGHVIAGKVAHAMQHAVPKLTDVIIHVDPCGHSGGVPHPKPHPHSNAPIAHVHPHPH